MKCDFSGYATKNDLKCSDGRIIRRDAFKVNDGTSVPLVWQHIHDDPFNVLGHADLENREDGVYAYCTFNDTEQGIHAKELVRHGDVTSMSIFANQLSQTGSNVTHGVIREVSLVLSGANPGARIENISIEHGAVDDYLDGDAVVHSGQPITIGAGFDTYKEEEKPELSHADGDSSDDDETIQDVIDSMNEKQQNVLYYLIGEVVEGDSDEDESDNMAQSEEGMNDTMKYNVFDGTNPDTEAFSHDAMAAIFDEAKETKGSLKKTFLKHGITDIEILYPEAKNVTPTPDLISRQMEWVSEVWNGTKKTPFARIKSVAADLTEDDARARGYIKGKRKEEEQFSLLKRTTEPQTVYKKQKLDRDDIIDITDLDVVAFLKAEMRMMFNEEISRAILVGDGRSVTSNDKIKEDKIRPIYQDDDMYTIHYTVNIPAEYDETETSNALVDAAVRSRKEYRGSGSPVFYASVDVINDMLLARDKVGHRLYGTLTELADALRVSKIVEVPVLEGVTRTSGEGTSAKTMELLGLIVNLSDYSVGTDRGGEMTWFEDFDIDFNQNKYLVEARMCGALTHPYSAIALEKEKTTSTTTPSTPSDETGTVG